MNWHIYNQRLSEVYWTCKFPPPKLSPLSTCPRAWLDERSEPVTWAPLRCIHCNSRWGLRLRGNIPHGSPHLFSDRVKKKSLLYQLHPTQATEPNYVLVGRPVVQATVSRDVKEWSGFVTCLFSNVNGINSHRPKTQQLRVEKLKICYDYVRRTSACYTLLKVSSGFTLLIYVLLVFNTFFHLSMAQAISDTTQTFWCYNRTILCLCPYMYINFI